MRGLGYTDEAIAQALAKIDGDEDDDDGDDFFIWPESRQSLELWNVVNDMWRMAPMGGLLGLEYLCVESTMRMMGYKNQRELFLDMRAMDRAARAALNKLNAK